MIQPGTKPDLSFQLSFVENGETKTAPFHSLLTGPTVVSVHMKNSSPSCDKQTEGQVALADAIAARGYRLIGLSPDTCASHVKYAVKKQVPYVLVSDPEGYFAKATDSMVEKSMYGKTYTAPARIAIIFDATGAVKTVLEQVTAKDLGPEILAHL